MSSIAGTIKGFFPGSPVKTGPLRSWNNGGAGKRLMQQGLISGMLAQSNAVADASRTVASRVTAGTAGLGIAAVSQTTGRGDVIFNGNVGWDPATVAQQIEIKRRDSVVANSLRVAVG
ncbi:hypothetical protein [Lapillicoccus jejuensis]|uniref:Uncharacterized protein n=1 Tax=Lapillicoccus jejuensis TaxID=402171 RepID=A0A542DVW2_9MICO|nr:hypothetical protein [Lapillicoccus jejuensis]TQJ07227.1 hypothetical protein FB458_0283 [Lapillicoccus jejuensis]